LFDLAIPLSGWIAISMFPALNVFGFEVPALVSAGRQAAASMFEIHEMLGNILLAFIGLHVAGALFHYFVLKDGIFERMWPRRKS